MPFYKAWNVRGEKESPLFTCCRQLQILCVKVRTSDIQLIFGHDLFHLQLMNIDTFISVYFAHSLFLFCLWISTEAKRKLGIDEDRARGATLKVGGGGLNSDSMWGAENTFFSVTL